MMTAISSSWAASTTSSTLQGTGFRRGDRGGGFGASLGGGCAVIGVADALKGQLPRAFVVLKAGAASEGVIDELIAAVRRDRTVASFKLADIVAALPKTRSGKILRKAMRAIADGRDEPYPPPSKILPSSMPCVLFSCASELRGPRITACRGPLRLLAGTRRPLRQGTCPDVSPPNRVTKTAVGCQFRVADFTDQLWPHIPDTLTSRAESFAAKGDLPTSSGAA